MLQNEIPSDDLGEELLQPPSRKRLPRFGIGGDFSKIAGVSLMVTVAVLMLMVFAGGVGFVTKQDFTENIANVIASLDQAKLDLANIKSEVASTTQGIPGTVATYVNNAVAQTTSQWSRQLSDISDRVTVLNTSVQSNIAQLNALGDDHKNDVDVLNDKVVALEAKVADYEVRIAELEKTSEPADIIESGDIGLRVSILDEGFPTVADNSSTTSLKLVVTNNTDRDITHLVVALNVYVGNTSSLPTSYSLAKSGDKSWYIRDYGGRIVEIRNNRADLIVGQPWKVYLDIRMQFPQAENDGVIDYDYEIISYD